MESILAVEMQQRIEREYEVNLGSDEIKNLTVGMIKEYRNGNFLFNNSFSEIFYFIKLIFFI